MSGVEGLLAKYDQHVARLFHSLRALLITLLPNVGEEADVSANVIGYGYGKGYKDTICTIILSKKGLKLGFYKGTELPDPAGLLEGKGKVHKYVVIDAEDDIASDALKQLILSALLKYKERTAV